MTTTSGPAPAVATDPAGPAVRTDPARVPGSPGTPAVPAAAPVPATPADGDPPWRAALNVLTTLGPPLTIATALMHYFGWARTEEQARRMGLDVTLFGYSPQDYVIRSISTLYVPLLLVGVVVLAWLAVHRRVLRVLDQPGVVHRRVLLVGRTLLVAGVLAGAVAVVVATVDRMRAPLSVPLALAVGTAVAAYGAWLVGAVSPGAAPAPPWHRALRTLVITGLITLALFWELSEYAGVVGRGHAAQVARSVPDLPRATAYSDTPLGIQAAGVVEEVVAASGDQTRYRTTGLRLLTRSGGRLFLLHDGWDPRQGTVVVVPDDDEIRWQFSR